LKFTLAPLALLLIPAAGMQMSDEVNWGPGDFLIMGVMLAGLGLAMGLFLAYIRNRTIRSLAIFGAILLFLLVWIELSVGIFGPG
jgi:ABC-type Mn2+/Zn2+ transport system permease subunit